MMKDTVLKWLSTTSISSVLSFFILEVAIKDDLYFSSDVFSASVYACGVIFVFYLLYTLMFLPFFFCKNRFQDKINDFFLLIAGLLIAILFAYSFYQLLGLNLTYRYFYIFYAHPAIVNIGILLYFLFLFPFNKHFATYRRIITIVFLLLLIVFVISTFAKYLVNSYNILALINNEEFIMTTWFFISEYLAIFLLFYLLIVLSNSQRVITFYHFFINIDKTPYLSRLNKLGRASFAVWTSLLILTLSYSHIVRPLFSVQTDKQRHAVLIVLDGLPAHKLNIFNPDSRRTTLDELFSKGAIYTNLHTSRPWTRAWTGTLYSGNTTTAFENARNTTGNNLFHFLQDNGVSSRWVAFHRNAIPETIAISDYSGIRSVILGEGFKWFPILLGLNYHITLPSSSINSLIKHNWLRKNLYNLLNNGEAQDNVFTQILIPELKQIRRNRNQSLIVFHVQYSQGKNLPPMAWDNKSLSYKDVLKKIRLNNYRYDPTIVDENYYIENSSQNIEKQISILGLQLTDFYNLLISDPQIKNTSIFITADHGTIYDKTRAWYGYHPNEEVLRVPFIHLNGGDSKVDNRLFASIDIPQTLLDYFSIEESLNPDAISLFSQSIHRFTSSLTLDATTMNEWFLVIYQDKQKYIFNLSPKSTGSWAQYQYKNYDEQKIDKEKDIPNYLKPIVATALSEYGNSVHNTHKIYQTLD